MVDSTNPRIMANNIRELESKIVTNDVEGNPSGSGYNTLLTKMKIDGKKFKLPNQVEANPEGEATDDLEKVSIGGTIFALAGGGLEEKTFTYTGDGNAFKDIEFPEDSNPRFYYISGVNNNIPMNSIFTPIGSSYLEGGYGNSSYKGRLFCVSEWNSSTKVLSLFNAESSVDRGYLYNVDDVEFTVHYFE